MACHPRATCHTAGCCHLANSMSWFQSHMPHCRMQSPGEINVVIVPHCRVYELHPPYWKSFFAIFNFFVFLVQFRLWQAADLIFVSSPILVIIIIAVRCSTGWIGGHGSWGHFKMTNCSGLTDKVRCIVSLNCTINSNYTRILKTDRHTLTQ